MPSILRSELALWAGTLTTVLVLLLDEQWFGDLSNPLWYGFLFVWLFCVMLWLAFGVVRHADGLALRHPHPDRGGHQY